MALSTTLSFFTLSTASPRMEVRASNSRGVKVSCVKPQVIAKLGGNGSARRSRRALTKKGGYSEYYSTPQRVPFLEERKLIEEGTAAVVDASYQRHLAENKYGLVNELAAEATKLVENDKDRYGYHRKALLQALSDRMNKSGHNRPDAYYIPSPIRGARWIEM